MDKQTTIAFVLIGIILVTWLYISSPGTQEPVKNTKRKDTVTAVTKDTVKQETPRQEIAKDTTSNKGGVFSGNNGDGSIITIENDLTVIELSTEGAAFEKVFLKKFKNWFAGSDDSTGIYYKDDVQLIDVKQGSAYNLAFVSTDGKAVNTANLLFTTSTNNNKIKVSGKDSVVIKFTYKIDSSSYINKIYTFYGDKYGVGSRIELAGMNKYISNNTYDLVWGSGINFVEQNSVDEANYSNASLYYGDEHVVVDASNLGEKIQKPFNGKVNWVGVRNKYFASLIAPQDPSGVDGAYVEGKRVQVNGVGLKENYSVRLNIPFKNTSFETQNFVLYMGPVNYDQLKTYNKKFESIVEFGSFFGLKFIVRPIAEYVLLPLFNFLHMFIPNYGVVIILFGLIIKVILYPLTKTSMQSMKKMQLLQPKITEIKEKFKDDPQKMNQETMKLYRVYGINPAGGCLPLLLQMPIFVALYGLFQAAIELRQQPFMLWIHDLSMPDTILQMPFRLPLFGVDHISGLALLMGVTTFVQQKMSVKDPKQQALVYVMPIMLTIMFMSFPAGLNLYYFSFNIFSILQQYYINHKHDGMVLEPVKNPNKKKGFMERMMETAEQQKKAQPKKRK